MMNNFANNLKNALFAIQLLLNSFSAFAQQWVVEAEPGGYVSWEGDSIADIYAPKGLTLWNTQLLHADCRIEYDARIVSDGRISDLNCFWMASDTCAKGVSSSAFYERSPYNVFENMPLRQGRFLYSYSLKLYYLGYGGNNNTTTRFRRYNGDKRGIDSLEYRPEIIREYLDPAHMIKGDHWYHIRLECQQGHVRYFIDGECLVDYLDPDPLLTGYFGFRTTLSHAQLRKFTVTRL